MRVFMKEPLVSDELRDSDSDNLTAEDDAQSVPTRRASVEGLFPTLNCDTSCSRIFWK